MMTDGSAEAIKTAEIVQNMLSVIGVTVEINNYDVATVWQMLYDPTAVYDMSAGNGIAPNRRVGDQLLNGVRYSPTMSAPGAFPDVEEYLELPRFA
jgi:ABC-type transport system substrate-binding protein